jgi:tRNA(Arg) A34 adenosine deaminase TadA
MATENPNLNHYLNKEVSELIKLEIYPIEDELKERHKLFSLLLMAITKNYWNGIKRGRNGTYPLNPKKFGKYEFNDYYGHNIASIAVDAYGEVIDFEFNHNKLYNSSTEHAEARMVKRVFNLTQINDSWKTSLIEAKPKDDYNTFEDVTLYTTLESCSQCAGIMALARVKEIVYLQTDPGMYLIGNILRNLTRKIENVPNSNSNLTSPMPISGEEFNFQFFNKLNDSYKSFKETVKTTSFYIPDNPTPQDKIDNSDSITSFLCTNSAFQIYTEATLEFESMSENNLIFPDYKPKNKKGEVIENAKTNKMVLAEVKDFYQYAIKSGKRGTPHK